MMGILRFLLAVFTVYGILSCSKQQETPPEFRILPGFSLQLVASEPQIKDPVDFEFNERGEAMVLEMPGYPVEDKQSRIVILKDKNDDGVYDDQVIFAEGLQSATSILPFQQIKAAHSKVRSGVDFPAYIQDIKKLGVTRYESFVADGHTDYFGKAGYKISSPAKYDDLTIANVSNTEQFKTDVKAHQQGKTDYPTFCNDCAKSGIEKWVVNIENMTCTYYSKPGNEVLVEQVPS